MADIVRNVQFIDDVRKIISYKFLTDGEILDLLAVSEIVEYSLEEPIVEEGEVSPFFFGIIKGTVSISVCEAEGNPVYVNTLGAGDVFGEAGIFLSVKRTATVTCQGDVTIIRIERKELVKFIKKHPEAGNKILFVIIYSLLRKLRMVNQELAFERRSDIPQEDIDTMVSNLFSDT